VTRDSVTTRLPFLAVLLQTTLCLAGSLPYEYETDACGDAVLRRTDLGNDGEIHHESTLPDVVSLKYGGWVTSTPTTDPYAGNWTGSSSPNLLRIDVTFAGVINPPGTLGLGSQPFDPYQYGTSPVFGFVEFDADRERDTGGECSGAALRYLANVARFGAVPSSSIWQRVAISGDDIDWSFHSAPQYERSGQEFSLVFCGCFGTSVVDDGGDIDGVFGAGETWIVRGRFFQRAGGLVEASAAFGGSVPQAYDPLVNLRFCHSIETNRTTVSLVYPVTMAGAAMLTGQPQQPIDLNVGNHTSIQEALEDIIDGVGSAFSSCGEELTEEWGPWGLSDALDPSRWRCSIIVGTSYKSQDDALYVWTDVGFEEVFGDFNSDKSVDADDLMLLDSYVAMYDGSPADADGVVDSCYSLKDFGTNFCLYDLNADGMVNGTDRAFFVPPPPPGDVNGDCMVNGADLSVILSNFSTSVLPGTKGDINGDGFVNGADLSVFLSNFGASC